MPIILKSDDKFNLLVIDHFLYHFHTFVYVRRKNEKKYTYIHTSLNYLSHASSNFALLIKLFVKPYDGFKCLFNGYF